MYVEAPDNIGGFVRHYETPELIRVAAPIYVKMGLRNHPDIYPSGTHLESTVAAFRANVFGGRSWFWTSSTATIPKR